MTEEKKHRALVNTLGCKVNRYDAESFGARLRSIGFDVFGEQPGQPMDVCVLFTCSVTAESDRKSRQAIRHLIRDNPDALIVAASCYAEIRPEDLKEIPGVDLVIGTSDLEDLPGEICSALGIHLPKESPDTSVHRFSQRTRAFVKIQDGCDQFCAYCQIPYTRGRPRSRDPESIVEEIRTLVDHGHPEVVLCGIRLGAFGSDREDPGALIGLMRSLEEVPGLVRYRLSSIEPNDISEAMIGEFPLLKKLAPHFHIPLQGGSDTLLRRMNRKYTTSDYAELIHRLRAVLPLLAVSTDLLVGFPGETEQEFEETKRFVGEMMFSKIHLFPFSCRPVTEAAKMKQELSKSDIQERRKDLMELSRTKAVEFRRSFVGQTLKVLLEAKRTKLPESESSYQMGYSENYLRVAVELPQGCLSESGVVYSVKIIRMVGNLLVGQVEQ